MVRISITLICPMGADARQAVGVGFAAHGQPGGLPLAIEIGLQDLPEGLAAAVALLGDPSSISRSWTCSSRQVTSSPLPGPQ